MTREVSAQPRRNAAQRSARKAAQRRHPLVRVETQRTRRLASPAARLRHAQVELVAFLEAELTRRSPEVQPAAVEQHGGSSIQVRRER